MKKILFLIYFTIFSNQIFSQVDQKKFNPPKNIEEEKELSPEKKEKLYKGVFQTLWQKEAQLETLLLDKSIQNRKIDSLSQIIKTITLKERVVDKEIVVVNVPQNISPEQQQSLIQDQEFLNDLPKNGDYGSFKKSELKQISKKIDNKIKTLTKETDSLKVDGEKNKPLVEAKEGVIKTLKKEKQIIDITTQNLDIKEEDKKIKFRNFELIEEKSLLEIYLYIISFVLLVLILIIAVFLQRRKIKSQDVEIETQLKDINKKNTYLDHAARIIRHDMHSGINTYIPRGISSLEKRITEEQIKELKIEAPIKMIKEGLSHTQKVYKNVYEFTNLVKRQVVLNKIKVNLKELLENFLSNTSYKSQVEISDLPTSEVNEILFCNAVDNLIKNGLKYNNSEEKLVKIYMEDNQLIVEDNGIGLTQKEFDKILNDYITDNKNHNEDSGLGLNICQAILTEHGFDLSCEEIKTGTKMKIKNII